MVFFGTPYHPWRHPERKIQVGKSTIKIVPWPPAYQRHRCRGPYLRFWGGSSGGTFGWGAFLPETNGTYKFCHRPLKGKCTRNPIWLWWFWWWKSMFAFLSIRCLSDSLPGLYLFQAVNLILSHNRSLEYIVSQSTPAESLKSFWIILGSKPTNQRFPSSKTSKHEHRRTVFPTP